MVETIIISLIILIALMIIFSDTFAMLLAHGLNNLFKLPHPGPNDIQGTCWCRRQEGPRKHTFRNYLKHLAGRAQHDV